MTRKDLLRVTLLFIGSLLAEEGLSSKLQASAGPVVLVSADTFADPNGLRPINGKPIYFVLREVKLTLGSEIRGTKYPPPDLVKKLVVDSLESQGFRQTITGGPFPDVVILAIYGDSNFDPLFSGPEAGRDRRKVENIVGTDKINKTPSLSDTYSIAVASNSDRMYLCVAAYEPRTFSNEKKRKILWRTAMSIQGFTGLGKSLPAMLASGAKLFGVAQSAPEFLGDRDRRATSVEIGELKTVTDPKSPATYK